MRLPAAPLFPPPQAWATPASGPKKFPLLFSLAASCLLGTHTAPWSYLGATKGEPAGQGSAGSPAGRSRGHGWDACTCPGSEFFRVFASGPAWTTRRWDRQRQKPLSKMGLTFAQQARPFIGAAKHMAPQADKEFLGSHPAVPAIRGLHLPHTGTRFLTFYVVIL